MKIQQTPNGWAVEPTTRDERQHLEWFFEALKESYAQVATTSEDSYQATRLSPSDHNLNTAS